MMNPKRKEQEEGRRKKEEGRRKCCKWNAEEESRIQDIKAWKHRNITTSKR
jgi:hypothetical protein